MNKNKKILAIFKAKQVAKRITRENPDLTQEEVEEKVITELFGEKGTSVLKDVRTNPDKYSDILKDIHI